MFQAVNHRLTSATWKINSRTSDYAASFWTQCLSKNFVWNWPAAGLPALSNLAPSIFCRTACWGGVKVGTRPSVRTFRISCRLHWNKRTLNWWGFCWLTDLRISIFVSALSRFTNATFSFRHSNVFRLFCFRPPLIDPVAHRAEGVKQGKLH